MINIEENENYSISQETIKTEKGKLNKEEIERDIATILKDIKINKKTISDSKKLTNFLMGKLKSKRTNRIYDFEIVNKISEEISKNCKNDLLT